MKRAPSWSHHAGCSGGCGSAGPLSYMWLISVLKFLQRILKRTGALLGICWVPPDSVWNITSASESSVRCHFIEKKMFLRGFCVHNNLSFQKTAPNRGLCGINRINIWLTAHQNYRVEEWPVVEATINHMGILVCITLLRCGFKSKRSPTCSRAGLHLAGERVSFSPGWVIRARSGPIKWGLKSSITG